MTKTSLNLRKAATIVACLAICMIFVACGKDGDGDGGSGGGGRTDGGSFTVTSGTDWKNAKRTIREGGNNKYYTIEINGNVVVEPSILFEDHFGNVKNIAVTLKGSGTLSPNMTSEMLMLNEEQTLIIDSDNLTLRGRSDNTRALIVLLKKNSRLELKAGTLTGNTNTFTLTQSGGAVTVYKDAGFIMSGGVIKGNKANDPTGGTGGGVHINIGGKFTKTGGTIYGKNESTNSNNARGDTWGHAVFYTYSSSTDYYRDITLGPSDNISTDNMNSGWTKR